MPAPIRSPSPRKKLRPSGVIPWTDRRCGRTAPACSQALDSDMWLISPSWGRPLTEGGALPRPCLLRLLFAVIAASSLSVAARANPAQDYMLYCMGCHGAQAEGVPGKVPPLAPALGLYMRTPAGRTYLLRVPGAANSGLS